MTWIVHQGDALAVLETLPAESVDAVITDPPYSSGGMFRADRTRASGDKYVRDVGKEKLTDFHGDSRDQRGFGYWCALWLGACWRVAKPGAMLAVFADWRQLPLVTDVVQAGGWSYRGIVPWNKTEGARPQKGWFRAQCEYIVVAAKGIPASLDVTGKGDAPALPGFYVCPVDRNGVHQTQKPVDLMRWLCQLTPRSGVVLDPFCGSGTTGVGALMEGRSFVGVEMTEHYAAHACRRLAETQQPGAQTSLVAAVGEQGSLFAPAPEGA